MRVITANLNGVRSAATKGFFDWAARRRADFVCVQELKAQDKDMTPAFRSIGRLNGAFAYALKKGYSGVGCYTHLTPDRVQIGLGAGFDDIDSEGRWSQVDIGSLTVVSVYFPSGSSGDERQAFKYRFMDRVLPVFDNLMASGRDVLICGDINIAHKEIDIKHWRANQDSSGFLPEERQWMTALFDEHGWADVFRRIDPSPDQYTWWSFRGRAWESNAGWRIDYQLATPGLAGKANAASIYLDQRFSDHAPLIIDYDYPLPE